MARRFEYAISLDRGGRLLAEDGTALEPGPAWTPEHLLLAGLARCTLKSLRFHAERAGLTVSGAADAAGVVTQREEDGRYALVEAQVGLDVRLDPLPAPVRWASFSRWRSATASSAPRCASRPSTSGA